MSVVMLDKWYQLGVGIFLSDGVKLILHTREFVSGVKLPDILVSESVWIAI